MEQVRKGMEFMKNSILKIIQGGLIGYTLSLLGYSYKTLVFWLVMMIMVIQFVKEAE